MGKASRSKVLRNAGTADSGGPSHQSTIDPARATANLLEDSLIGILAVIAGFAWLASHFDAPVATLFGATFLASGVALGWVSPIAGTALAVITVPFTGGAFPWGAGDFGVSEGLRAAPIWGAIVRLVWLRIRAPRDANAIGSLPPTPMFVAALVAALLAPLTRVTAQGQQGVDPTGLATDIMGIVGTQSTMWGAWIVASHLRRKSLAPLSAAIAIGTSLGVLLALAGWLGIPGPSLLIFDPIVFGRLAALGYPTPTGMGLAVALPIATAALWRWSRGGAIALAAAAMVAIILTESRGALLALLGGAAIATAIARGISRRWILAIVAGGAVMLMALLAVRYGDQLFGLFAGKFPDLKGDSYRIQSWIAAVQVALESPLTGGGWSSVGRFDNDYFFKRGLRVSHNTILQALSDGGFPLGIAVAVVVIGSLVLLWRNRRSLRPEWIASAIAIVVCGAWDIPQLRAYAALMGGLALGLVSRRDRVVDESEVDGSEEGRA